MNFSRLRIFSGAFALALTATATLALACGAAGAEDRAAEADEEVVKWLDRLEERGRAIETLHADVYHAREDALLGEEQLRIGKVWYASGDDETPARFAIHFEWLAIDDAQRRQERKYIFDGEWLAEVQEDRRLFHRRQVMPPGGRLDPLQIDGPFPLPIGQRRDDVLARFDVAIVEDDAAAEAGQIRMRLTPRDDVEQPRGQAEFDRVEMWFDRETLLPARVETQERQYKTTVALEDKQVDQMDEAELAGRFDTAPPPAGAGWRVEISPWED